MVDPGAAQAILRLLNRWYRKRAKPRGTVDYFHRGVRMTYTAACRAVVGGIACFMLLIAGVLFCVPAEADHESPTTVLLLKLGWMGLVILAVLMLLQVFREHLVVTEDGLVRSDLFARETRMPWKDIRQFQVKTDDNQVIFRNEAKGKMKASLSYDGWRDFLDLAARRMEPALFWQFGHTFRNIDVKPVKAAKPKTQRLAPKWLFWGRRRA